jgi:hypothetical protein
MNKTELSQGRGRMPVLIDDAAEIRQARLQGGHQRHRHADVRKLDVRHGRGLDVMVA